MFNLNKLKTTNTRQTSTTTKKQKNKNTTLSKRVLFFSFCGFHSCLGNEREGPHPSQPEDIPLLLKCHVKVVVSFSPRILIGFCGNNSAGPQSSHTGVSANKGLSDFTWHRCNIHTRGEKQQSVKLQKKVSTAVRPDQVACSPWQHKYM